MRRRYAIVQVHNPPDFLLLAALGPRLLGARMILDVHDLAPDMFNMRFGGRRGAATAEWILVGSKGSRSEQRTSWSRFTSRIARS